MTATGPPEGGGGLTRRDLPRPLYFWHIPKTAGTAVTRAIDSLFAPEAILPGGLLGDIEAAPPAHLGRVGVMRGHFGALPVEALGWAGVTTLTVLREPVDLLLSLHAHLIDNPAHYLHEAARETPLARFIRQPHWTALATDIQARWLAVSPSGPNRTWEPPVDRDYPWRRQAAYDLWPHGLSERALYRRGAATLRRITVVGTTAHLDTTLGRLAAAAGLPPIPTPPRVNVSATRTERDRLDPADLEHLRGQSRVDRRLYELALRRAERGDGPGRPWRRARPRRWR